MIFYRINSAVPYFVGTQADAKRDARMCKCDWSQVDIPTDKQGLMDYLNGLEVYAHGAMGEVQVETAQDEQNEVLAGALTRPASETLEHFDRALDRRGPRDHRIAERAAFLGTSEEIALLTDRIGELDGWPLGQVALAAASRLKELAT